MNTGEKKIAPNMKQITKVSLNKFKSYSWIIKKFIQESSDESARLVQNSQTLCCLVWWWCQEIFRKYFSVTVPKSNFLMVIWINDEKKIQVFHRQFWRTTRTDR